MGVAINSVIPSSVVSAAGDIHLPASNTAAVVTYAADSAAAHIISGVVWSYSADPTGGNLKIENGSGTTVFSMDISSGGAGFIPFAPFKKGSLNTAMIITLAAGGSGITGKLSIPNHWTE